MKLPDLEKHKGARYKVRTVSYVDHWASYRLLGVDAFGRIPIVVSVLDRQFPTDGTQYQNFGYRIRV